jgi:DNA-binding NtrC family response regulator
MCAHIVVAHNDPTFLLSLASALRAVGHDVAAFDNSMAAWDAISGRKGVEILISRVRFPAGSPYGNALAKHAYVQHPGLRVIFTAAPEMREYADNLTIFLPTPVSVVKVLATVAGLLTPCLAIEAVSSRP